MTDEQLQFAISQYVDGTLPAQEAAELEQRLKTDGAAQRTLVEYRKLNELLARTLPAPEMDWEQLSRQISAAVDDASVEDGGVATPIAIRPARSIWWGPLALAASLLIVAGMGLLLWVNQRPAPQQIAVVDGGRAPEAGVVEISIAAPPALVSPAQVSVLQRDVPVGEPVVQVAISEAPMPWFPQVLESYRDLTSQPSARVVIAALPIPTGRDADEDFSLLY